MDYSGADRKKSPSVQSQSASERLVRKRVSTAPTPKGRRRPVIGFRRGDLSGIFAGGGPAVRRLGQNPKWRLEAAHSFDELQILPDPVVVTKQLFLGQSQDLQGCVGFKTGHLLTCRRVIQTVR